MILNILIAKDEYAYARASKEKIFRAHIAGFWKDGMFQVKKNRFDSSNMMTPEDLIAAIESYQNFYERSINDFLNKNAK